MEFLYEYGLYLAKAITLVVAVLVIIANIAGAAMKQKSDNGQLEITSLSEQLEELKTRAFKLLLDKKELKKYEKEQKKAAKEEKTNKSRLFVIDFNGSMDAHEVESLRKEVTAVLQLASDKDEVLVRLESGGGVVHGYGLAASQLQRIRDKDIKLTVSVDKVAASGGYMMACVADQVLSAKFAIIGSIGVVAQLPNFNKLLKKNDIEFEQHTAGQFKRTLTVFGENTDEGRDKFKEELDAIHVMFKDFVSSNRESLDIDKVATGEYWYGQKALELGLVDTIQTSDDYLLAQVDQKNVFKVAFEAKKPLMERLTSSMSVGIERGMLSVWAKLNRSFR